MPSQILVPLRGSDRVEKILVALKGLAQVDEVVPYLQEVVKPGMRIVFLVPYPLEFWAYLAQHWVEAETAREAISASKTVVEQYSWETQKSKAEQRVYNACAAFTKNQVEVSVELYTASLRRTVQDHLTENDVQWVVTNAKGGDWIGSLYAKIIGCFGGSTSWPSIRVFSPHSSLRHAAEKT